MKNIKELVKALPNDEFKIEILTSLAQIQSKKNHELIMIDFSQNPSFLRTFLSLESLTCKNYNIEDKCKEFCLSKEKNLELELLANGQLETLPFEKLEEVKTFLCSLNATSFLTQMSMNKALENEVKLLYFSLKENSLQDEILLINKMNFEQGYFYIIVLDENIENRYIWELIQKKSQEKAENFLFISDENFPSLEGKEVFSSKVKIEDENILEKLKAFSDEKAIEKDIQDLKSYIKDYYFQVEGEKNLIKKIIANDEALLQEQSEEKLKEKDEILLYFEENIKKMKEILQEIDIQKSAISKLINSQGSSELRKLILASNKKFDEENWLLNQALEKAENREVLAQKLNNLNLKYLSELRKDLNEILSKMQDEASTLSNEVFDDFKKFLSYQNATENF